MKRFVFAAKGFLLHSQEKSEFNPQNMALASGTPEFYCWLKMLPMAKSSQSFNKREKEKQKAKERQEKRERAEERKAQAKKGKSLEDMLAYIDENGNISSTPPDPSKIKTFNAEDIIIGVPQHTPEEEESGLRTGTVAFFNTTKGFGFIKDNRSGESIFVHISQLAEPLKEGERVQFETEMGAKGPVAINIQKDK